VKMRELKALERSLVAFVESCNTSCAGGPGPDCVILDDLTKSPASERHRTRRVSSPS
jgi:MerR family transcriptional regulator, copper efflux regulator